MDYRLLGISRLGILVVVATGCLSASAAGAGGPGCNSAFCGEPQGPIFKTLDALAGGIESVLQRTVLSRRKSAGCDAIGCDTLGGDDGCDRITLQQLEPSPGYGIGPRQMPLRRSDGSVPGIQSLPKMQPLRKPLPQVPADRRVGPPALSGEDGWIESFSSSQPSSRNGQPQPATPQNQHYDALPNPFLDDPQYSR